MNQFMQVDVVVGNCLLHVMTMMMMMMMMVCDNSPSEGACCTQDCQLVSQHVAYVCRQETSCQTASFCEYPLILCLPFSACVGLYT